MHPKFEELLDSEGEKLVGMLSPVDPEMNKYRAGFEGTVDGVFNVDLDKIKPTQLWHIDKNQKQISIFFNTTANPSADDIGLNDWIGLNIKAYKMLQEFVLKVVKDKNISQRATKEFIEEVIVKWLSKKFDQSDQVKLSQFINEEMVAQEKQRRLLFLISGLDVSTEIKIGPVSINKISESDLEVIKYTSSLQYEDEERKEKMRTVIERELKDKTFAFFEHKVILDKGIQLGRDFAERALDLLRFYSPSAVNINWFTNFELSYKHEVRFGKVIHFEEVNHPVFLDSSLDEEYQEWRLDEKQVQSMKQAHFDYFASVLFNDSIQIGSTQHLISTSLNLFSRSLTFKSDNIKIIFLLSVVEGILLKNSNEPIIQSISIRLAFLLYPQRTTEDIKHRELVVHTVKDIYKIRSKFLHHGLSEENKQMLSNLLFFCRKAIFVLANNASKWETKDQIIEDIERRILQ